jgi:Ricin-type beta-trefoil lectin domain
MFRKRFSIAAVAAIALIGVLAGPAQASRPNVETTTSPTLSSTQLGNLRIPRPGADAAVTKFLIYNELTGGCIGISGTGEAGDWLCQAAQSPDQIWRWGPGIVPGYAQLVNDKGQCLAVAGGSTTVGARIVGYRCIGPDSRDQYWSWNGEGYIVNLKATNRIIGIEGASQTNGAPLVLWRAENHSDQIWYQGIL